MNAPLTRRFLAMLSLAALPLVASTVWAQAPATKKAPAPVESAVKPVPRSGGWMKRHEQFNARVKQGHVDLLFIGDSITHGWEGNGKDVWKEYYGGRNAVNLGIGGDRTQHVLWRLEHGNIDGISPKLAVLMIGTNNAAHGNTPAEIAAGVKAIVTLLRERLPQTKVLILAIFPRGADKNDPRRLTNIKANAIISKFADGKNVLYQDLAPSFLKADGTLSKEIMPDLLHLSPAGYKIWAQAIEPAVEKIVGKK